MTDRPKYSSVQLACAKAIVVLAASIAFGLRVETQASKRAFTVVGVILVIAGSALIYEMAARGLARLFGVVFGRAPVVGAAADVAAAAPEAAAVPTTPSLKQLGMAQANLRRESREFGRREARHRTPARAAGPGR